MAEVDEPSLTCYILSSKQKDDNNNNKKKQKKKTEVISALPPWESKQSVMVQNSQGGKQEKTL